MQTTQQSTAVIRAFRPTDYAEVARVFNATFAEFSVTPLELQFEDSQCVAPCQLARWVAECDGRMVGFAHYAQSPNIYHPRKFQLTVCIDPDYQLRGVGGALYDLVEAEVRRFDPLTVDEWARADMTRRVGFLERRGFVEDMRLWTSTLDLTRFDSNAFAANVAAVERQGIQLRSWADLGADDQRVRRLSYELWREIRHDVPISPNDTRVEMSYEQWWERNDRPDLLPGGYFVALDGNQYVGTSQLFLSPEPGELRTGLTGVRREYRRRGIAAALKVRALAFARADGYARVVTENEINNQGMISLNDRMGFVKHPAWLHFVKSFDS